MAKRRAAFFGRSYDAAPGPEQPIPDFLAPLRERFAAWADVDPMTGESRQAYEPSIPPVDSLRYSITFRTLR